MDIRNLQFKCFYLEVLLVLGFLDVSCVKINRLLVPEIASQAKPPVILDCDYSLENPGKDEGLVVKWFFNERMYPVYQWIPDAKPQELGILKGRLDLSYKASTDRLKMYRALKIEKLGPELEGNYTCTVSTFLSEDSKSGGMLVFIPEKSLELKYPPLWEGTDNNSKIVCYVENIYPRPRLRLFLNESEIENATMNYLELTSGLYNVELVAAVKNLTDGTSILCELNVDMANYTIRKEAIYYKVWNSSNNNARGHRLFLRLFFVVFVMYCFIL
ncbi:uncharacterized protein LOC126733836 [Anthonomus grandis grandis]|uniref:uncharacterized protein LOC126733836 n=1 Tax=Anthonomus grandis grandis TaxID=2921223 RepID=UPI002166A3B6|nr:uncharacterized protein LOC126733836 [Anthonomus grandis grandis]